MSAVTERWGFDIDLTPPFMAFSVLRTRALQHFGEAEVLDLSQGEPGYGFAPNIRSRRFFAFLLLLDIQFNNNDTEMHFAEFTAKDLPKILDEVRVVAQENYLPEIAAELLADFNFFLSELQKIATAQNLQYGKFEILYDIFKYSIPAGGRYPNPWGEPIVRAAVAEHYHELFALPIFSPDVMLLSGAAHGIGTVFKALGEEGIGYLQPGDTVLVTSPVYAPYNELLRDRGINIFSLSLAPETGEADPESLGALQQFTAPIKAMILINPNNPTGFPYGMKLLQVLSDIAEKHNSLIIADEVYLEFFQKAPSILALPAARKRTIHISSLSKTERATGVRFGSYLLLPEAKKYISENILANFLGKYKSIENLLFLAKSPGGKTIGAFQHITGIPGPAQILGLSHLILGREEKEKYLAAVRKKVEIFYAALGLPLQANSYYGVFDITPLQSTAKEELPTEQKFLEIAERGVVLMPANLFFSAEDRARKNCRNYVRVSLPNLSFENTKKAAEIIRKYLQE